MHPRIRRKRAAIFVAIAGLVSCRSTPAPPPPGPHDVVLVTIDTLRADHVGAYGYHRDTTPGLDRIARDGVRFANAASVSSWTMPAHASILTGLEPAEHGLQTSLNALPESARTLGEILGDAGYETAGFVSHVYMTERYGFGAGLAHFDDTAAKRAPQTPVSQTVVDRVLAWLDGRRSRGDERPFFLWVHLFDPHWDYIPPPPHDTAFDADYEGTIDGKYRSLAPFIKEGPYYDPNAVLATRDLEHLLALYDGEIAYTDAQLQRLWRRLEDDGTLSRTVIAIASDHGEEFMEHGSLEGHQWTLYDEVVMVPLVFRFPDPALNVGTVDALVSTVGVAGTILDALAIEHELPTLMPRIDGTGAGEPEIVFMDLTVRRTDRQIAVRTPDRKLIRYDDGRAEFFRNPDVGAERENQAARYRDDVRELDAAIDAYLDSIVPLPDAGAKRSALDPATVRRLRATGYLD